jgi:N-acetylneuraminic acid mutarotase
VTSGNNGTCTPAALCTAGPGYDGPTGLGTPDGLAAFRSGPHGVISGTVTDRAGGTPLAGATVEAGDHRAVSDASGRYRLDIPPGTYDLTVSAYGYASATDNGVVLADGATVTESFALDAVPRQTVTGKVTDGSGHGWPLYARVSADGVPGGPVFTDPVTGAFTLTLPQNATYTLHIASDYPGYRPVDKTVQVGTAATPDDAALGDGFYWMFSHLTGKHQVSAESAHYAAATATADVPADGTVRRNLSLKAGRLKVTPASIEKTTAWGGSAQQQVTVKNTGTAPATVTLGENPGGAVIQRAGAPLDLVKGHYSPHSLAAHGKAAGPAHPGAVEAAGSAAAGAAQGTAGTAWQAVPDLPAATGDNAVAAYQGTVYSAFGFTGTTDTSVLYADSADSGAWTELAPAADTRESPAHRIINGRFYAAGGWGASGDPDAKLEIYDIASDTWTTGAADPAPYAGSGSAVLDGRLYAVGGCTATACGATDVSVYDPATDSWSAAAAYPEPVAWQACGAVAGKLYCAGGTTDAGSITHGYVYDPAGDSWAPIADQPTDAWGSAYASANGLLLVEGGAVDNGGSLTNQAWAYRPADNTWTALPDANASLYRGGGAAGFYAIGGLAGQTPAKASEVLPGYDQPDSTDVSWLSESTGTVTLAPGASTAVTVTLDASVPEITQPGTYTASPALSTDTPYRLAPIGVSLTVKPPAGWGKITGTVTASGGAPIAGATVQITTWAAHYTLKTTADGTYALWLDVRNNPLQLIVAKDGYQPNVAKVKIRKGATTTRDFTLLKD